MSVTAWIGLTIVGAFALMILGLAFVKPDYDKYPDGKWPPK